MKVSRSILLAFTISTIFSAASFAQTVTPPPDLVRVMVQAKNVYIVTGHVRYYKTKAIVKRELVDSTPFEEPSHKEIEKWGRFTIVPDFKKADLYIRVYEKGTSNVVPVNSGGVTGSVNVGTSYIILDVIQPSTKKILWADSKNVARSWSTNTAVGGLMKHLREYLEAQEKTMPSPSVVQTNASPDHPPQVVEQPNVEPPQ